MLFQKRFLYFFIFLLFIIFPQSKVFAQVVINEFSSASSDDWVELYTDNDNNIDISGWVLRDVKEDGSLSSLKSVFPQNTVIGPSTSSYYIIDLNTRLNKDGDIIKLYSKDEAELINEISYGDKGGICAPDDSSQSIGRDTDGNSLWVRFQTSTKAATNNGAPKEPCPSPSPTLTPIPPETPIPTDTPSPTKTPAPTHTPIPTKTPTPKPPSKTPTKPQPTSENQAGQVLGNQNINISTPPSPAQKTLTENSSISGAKISLVLGLLFCGVAIMIFTQRVYQINRKNEKI